MWCQYAHKASAKSFFPLLDFTGAHPGGRNLSTTWLGGMFSQQNLSEDSSQSRNTLSCFRAERKTYIQEEWFTFQGKWDGVNCLTEALASRLESWKTCDDSHYSHPNTSAKASLCRQLFPLSGPWPTNHRCCLRPALSSEKFITLYSHTRCFFVLL